MNGFTLETFEMVKANFQIKNKFEKTCFFQETFFVANIHRAETLECFFQSLALRMS